MLREACAQARRWQLEGAPPIRIAVNVSARQVEEPDFARLVTDACDAVSLLPSYLELELTERVMMQPEGVAAHNLAALQRTGVRVAVDDFGTGYSALSYLTSLPLDALKLDRSFIERIGEDGFQRKIVASMIDLAHHRRLSVVAEGVESACHADDLRRMGCDEGQGYFFAPPMPACDMTATLRGTGALTSLSA